MHDACLDLLLGGRCAVCDRPGRVLCPECAARLPPAAAAAWPSPCPPGLAFPAAAGEYDGPLRALVNAHKERQQFSLARPLGRLLARSAELVAATCGLTGRWCLVPVPSRAAVVRARGHDPVLRMTRAAASALRARGADVSVARLLSYAARTRDQAALGADERAANLAGSMRVPPRRAVRHAHAPGGTPVVVADDVVTTGATLREAQRALQEAGVEVAGVAVVAATRRRWIP